MKPTLLQQRIRVVLRLLADVQAGVGRGEPADGLLSRRLKEQRSLGGRDRRFSAEAVFSYFRWQGWLDRIGFLGPEAVCALAYLLDAPGPNDLAEALLAQADLADLPIRALGGGSVAEKGAALRAWLQGKLPSYFPRFAPDPGPLVPDWVGAVLQRQGGADSAEHRLRCIESFQVRPPTWLRVRSTQREAIVRALTRSGAAWREHPRIAEALSLPGSPDLAPLRSRHGGSFWVQDLASQCVGLACAPKPSEHWWDACAGAGGKSLLLLDLLQGKGSVLATEIRPSVLAEARARVRRANFSGFTTRVLDAASASPPGPLFDGVLVDAPCTALGTWSRNPDARWRTGAEEVGRKARVQARILKRSAAAVRPGGILVYAVCTLTHAETAGVIDAFLREHKEFAPDPIAHPLTAQATDGRLWVWPWEGPGDGMFIARLRRSD